MEGKYKPRSKCVAGRFKVYDPKKRCRARRIKGLKLELLIMDALKRMGLLRQFAYCPNGKVDWKWIVEGWEIECKNFEDTGKDGRLLGKAWMRDEVVSRFSENAKRKVLVATKKCWNEEAEAYLQENNVEVILVGSVSRKRLYERAIEKFEAAFLDLVRKTATEKVVVIEGD